MTNINDTLAALAARPKNWRVTTMYADGATRVHDVHSIGQAENWATGERAKLGRNLIQRDTGKTVRVIAVTIDAIR